MGTHRPYRSSLGLEAALQEMEQRRGLHYDARVVDASLHLFRGNDFRLETMVPQW